MLVVVFKKEAATLLLFTMYGPFPFFILANAETLLIDLQVPNRMSGAVLMIKRRRRCIRGSLLLGSNLRQLTLYIIKKNVQTFPPKPVTCDSEGVRI